MRQKIFGCTDMRIKQPDYYDLIGADDDDLPALTTDSQVNDDDQVNEDELIIDNILFELTDDGIMWEVPVWRLNDLSRTRHLFETM